MFNEVIVKCPSCRSLMALRSTSGTCAFESHAVEEADRRDVEAVMDRIITCYKCGVRYKVLSMIYRNIGEVNEH